MYVCMYVRTYEGMYKFTHVCVCVLFVVRVYEILYVCMYVCLNVYMSECLNV